MDAMLPHEAVRVKWFFGGLRELPWQRDIETYFRAGFLSGAELAASHIESPESVDLLTDAVARIRAALLRWGPKRGLNLDVATYRDRFNFHAFFRGMSHGLQYGGQLVGCQFEMQQWLDIVGDWAHGDPDLIEFPPIPSVVSEGVAV